MAHLTRRVCLLVWMEVFSIESMLLFNTTNKQYDSSFEQRHTAACIMWSHRSRILEERRQLKLTKEQSDHLLHSVERELSEELHRDSTIANMFWTGICCASAFTVSYFLGRYAGYRRVAVLRFTPASPPAASLSTLAPPPPPPRVSSPAPGPFKRLQLHKLARDQDPRK